MKTDEFSATMWATSPIRKIAENSYNVPVALDGVKLSQLAVGYTPVREPFLSIRSAPFATGVRPSVADRFKQF